MTDFRYRRTIRNKMRYLGNRFGDNLVLDDDDPEKWEYDSHTKAKHEVIKKYIQPWTYKLAKYNKKSGQKNKLRIFDCFAGRGEYVEDRSSVEGYNLPNLDIDVEYPGSPLIILDRIIEHQDKYEEFDLVLMEKKKNNFQNLESIIEETRIPEKINLLKKQGDYRDLIGDMIKKTGGENFPTLLFLDPFGFKALDYDLISDLVSTRLFETLITFMARDMKRFLDSEKHQSALNNVFGEEDWREKIDNYDGENWEPLVDYYVDILSEAGAKHHFEYMICEPDSKKTIYYLVHTSNNIQGKRTFREVTSRCGTGNFAYAPRLPKYDRDQTKLIGGGKDFLKKEILPQFEEFRIPWNRLCEEVIEGEFAYEDFNESDLRCAVKELEENGDITIKRLTSKQDGVQKFDLIDFRDWDVEN